MSIMRFFNFAFSPAMDRVPSARLISWYSSSPSDSVFRATIDAKLVNSFWFGFKVAFSLDEDRERIGHLI